MLSENRPHLTKGTYLKEVHLALLTIVSDPGTSWHIVYAL